MNLNLAREGDVLVVGVDELQIGADLADEFRSRVAAELPEEGGCVAIDLTKVDFMDSSGLGVLVSLLKKVRPEGNLVLYGLRPSVAEILRLTHLDAVFGCQPDRAAALAALTQPAA